MNIYKITNLINGKIYIGQTIRTLQERFKEHCRERRNKNHMPIVRAIQKYGKDNFKIELMKKCKSLEEMNYYEMLFILFAKQNLEGCYNIFIGGGNKKHTEEIKRKMSLAKKGKKKPESFKNFIRMRNLTNNPAKKESVRKKISDSHKGKILSEETRKKMSLAKRKKFTKHKKLQISTHLKSLKYANINRYFKPSLESKQFLDKILG